jgi:hypothetical protein
MGKKVLTLEQKKLDKDLMIIALATFAVYGIYMTFGNQLMSFVQDSSISIFLRVLVNAALQFGIAGLGITIVCVMRREAFTSHGLRIQGALSSIGLSVLCFVPHFLFLLFTGQITEYAPLSIIITEDILAGNLFVKIVGMLVIAIVWGFFEGFNYVVISDKINKRYPSTNKWLDWGALSCAIICILFHPFNTSILGLIEIASIFVLIYGMLLVKKHTNNAFGSIFIFLFLWNAF